jgi:tetratricopeptide (TPR) repeat protein
MRIDRLRSADKRLLQTIAACGYEVETKLLADVAGINEEQLWTSLLQLIELEFLVMSSHASNDILQFKHPLTHDVAYQSLLQAERKRLHRRIMTVFEKRQEGQISFETLAFHAERAAEMEKAVDYLKSAGEQGLSRSACQHALHCFKQALDLLPQAGDAPSKTEAEIDLELEIRNALLPLGRQAEILPHLRRAESLSRQLGDETRLARVLSCIAHYYWLAGEWHNAIEVGQHAVQAADALQNLGLMVTTRFVLGLARYSTGNFNEAISNLAFNARMLQGARARERFGMLALPAVVSRGYLAWCLAERGDFTAAFEPALEAKAISEQFGREFDQVQGYLGLCHVYLLVGEPREAVVQLEQALELCETADIRVLVPRVAACLGYAYGLEGQVEKALQMAERALHQADALSLAAMRSLCLRWAGEVKLMGGQVSQALDIADGLWRHCRASGEAGNEAWALYLSGSALANMGRSDESADALCKSIRLAEGLGMLPLLAHCRRRLGTVEVARERHEEGQHHLVAAAAIYRELGMAFWLKAGPEALACRRT